MAKELPGLAWVPPSLPLFLELTLVFGVLMLLSGSGVAACRWGPVTGTFFSLH